MNRPIGGWPIRDPVLRMSLKRRVILWFICKAWGHDFFVDPLHCSRCHREFG